MAQPLQHQNEPPKSDILGVEARQMHDRVGLILKRAGGRGSSLEITLEEAEKLLAGLSAAVVWARAASRDAVLYAWQSAAA